nr:hypothetical protein CRG98_024951 [Ipomoea trifida]
MKARDHELVELMERSQTKYQIILTKTDTVFPIDVARRAMQIEENLKASKSAVQPLVLTAQCNSLISFEAFAHFLGRNPNILYASFLVFLYR